MAKTKVIEEDRDVVLRITIPTYGTKDQRIQTAANIKRILEVNLQKEVEVEMKIGREYQPVERQDRNAVPPEA